jgi:hypothetical protein
MVAAARISLSCAPTARRALSCSARLEKEAAPLAKKIRKNMSFARLDGGIFASLLAFPGKLPYHFGFGLPGFAFRSLIRAPV